MTSNTLVFNEKNEVIVNHRPVMQLRCCDILGRGLHRYVTIKSLRTAYSLDELKQIVAKLESLTEETDE